jgi:hypothetical protein
MVLINFRSIRTSVVKNRNVKLRRYIIERELCIIIIMGNKNIFLLLSNVCSLISRLNDTLHSIVAVLKRFFITRLLNITEI